MLPYFDNKVDHQLNQKTILKALNNGNIFDFEPHLNDQDLLHLAFKFENEHWHHSNYGFEFKNGKWKKAAYDALMWMWHHEEKELGIIENAIDKK